MARTASDKSKETVTHKRCASHQSKIEKLKSIARDLVTYKDVPEQDWVWQFNKICEEEGEQLSKDQVARILADAKSTRDGRMEIAPAGAVLNPRPIPWLWEGIIMKSAVNLVYAAPKCGKTRLILGLLASVVNKTETFLGRPVTYKGEKVLLLGPDQPEGVWADMLKQYRLMGTDNRLHSCFAGMVWSGMRFALNETGIAMVEDYARENPGLIIIVDSFQRAIGPMGLDENRPEASVPLTRLMESVAPFGATIIVIHHANKQGAGGPMANAARGTTALTAVPDQLVSLRPFTGEKEPGTDKQIELATEGRGGKPVALLLSLEEDGRTWMSHGSPSEKRAQEKERQLIDELTVYQREALDVFMDNWRKEKKGMTQNHLTLMLGPDTETSPGNVKERIRGLTRKGLIEKSKDKIPTKGRPGYVHQPTPLALKHLLLNV